MEQMTRSLSVGFVKVPRTVETLTSKIAELLEFDGQPDLKRILDGLREPLCLVIYSAALEKVVIAADGAALGIRVNYYSDEAEEELDVEAFSCVPKKPEELKLTLVLAGSGRPALPDLAKLPALSTSKVKVHVDDGAAKPDNPDRQKGSGERTFNGNARAGLKNGHFLSTVRAGLHRLLKKYMDQRRCILRASAICK